MECPSCGQSTLERVAGLPEEELYSALDEARDRAVVEERTGPAGAVTHRFTHAFFRQTLYEELSAPHRIRLHQQVARALEEVHARRTDDHAAELAEHFAHSSDAGDLDKAIRYGELAAKRALSVYAYGEAARCWTRTTTPNGAICCWRWARRCCHWKTRCA